MLKLTAMEWLVHLTTHRKNSPVQFVPNKIETLTHTNAECSFSALQLSIKLRMDFVKSVNMCSNYLSSVMYSNVLPHRALDRPGALMPGWRFEPL